MQETASLLLLHLQARDKSDAREEEFRSPDKYSCGRITAMAGPNELGLYRFPPGFIGLTLMIAALLLVTIQTRMSGAKAAKRL